MSFLPKTKPPGWSSFTVGELAQYINGFAFKPTDWEVEGLPIIRIQNLTDTSKPLNYTTRCVDQRFVVRTGEILVSWSATLDAYIWRGPTALLNQHIFRVVPDTSKVDPKFLFYLLRCVIRDMAESEHLHGSTMKHINRGPFVSFQVFIPSLDEQRRIVTRIEEMMERVQRVRGTLDRINSEDSRLRLSLLQTAWNGELSATQRDKNIHTETASDLLEKIDQEKEQRWKENGLTDLQISKKRAKLQGKNIYVNEESIPRTWKWATLGDLAWDASYGTSAKCEEEGEGEPVLRIPNIVHGQIDLTDIKRAVNPLSLRVMEYLDSGDFLIVRTNGSVSLIGRAALISQELGHPHAFASYLIRYRLVGPKVLQEWVSLIWQAPCVREQIERLAASSAGQYNLSLEKILSIAFPVPPLWECAYLVNQIKDSFKRQTTALTVRKIAEAGVDQLDHSILTTAFNGGM